MYHAQDPHGRVHVRSPKLRALAYMREARRLGRIAHTDEHGGSYTVRVRGARAVTFVRVKGADDA